MVGPLRRISLYVHELAHTGVVRNSLILADALRAEAEAVEIVTALPGGEVPAEVQHVTLLEGPGRSRLAEHRDVILPLRRHLRRARPDLAISMGNHGHAAFWAALRALPDQRRIYRISNDLRRTAPGAPRPSLSKRLTRPLFSRLLVADADAIVLLADGLLPEGAETAGRATGKLRLIPNGIDIERARERAGAPSPHPWLDGPEPVVLAVGRLNRQKNFGTLLEAIALQPAARLVILGTSRDDSRERLLERADRLGLGDRLLLPGTTENVFAWMARAAVVVQPSWWEGFSVVPLEAMALGIPVVASRTAGNAAQVIGERHGLLVDPADPRQMAEAIARQIDPERRVLPGARAEDYALTRTLDAWRTLVRELAPVDPAVEEAIR